MSKSEHQGAKGIIHLKVDRTENSEWYEKSKGAELYAITDSSLMLHEFDYEEDLRHKIKNEDSACYEIGVEELIKLIKINGKQASHKGPI